MYVVRAILMDLIEQLNTAQLLTFIEVPPAALTGELGPELKAEFGGLFNGSLVLTLIRNALGSLKPLDANSKYE